MPKKTNISLIGFRGTGKTVIGKKLAKRLNMKFIDTDQSISKKNGKTIPQIFADVGEKGFRRLEEEAVKEAVSNENACIAFGGGVVLSKANVDSIKRNSTVILLEAGPKVIFNRIKNDKNRPSLTNKEVFEEILHLLETRKALYEGAAEMKIDTSNDSMDECVQKIIDLLDERGLL